MASNPILNWHNYAIALLDLDNIPNPVVKARRVAPIKERGRRIRIDGIMCVLVSMTDRHAEAEITSLRHFKPNLRAWRKTAHGQWEVWSV